eukprot:gnl/TRDRNA2_/TRDRNA2_34505_c0_seq1.p1 gnl/TRDRNA2_/TRDRNA2_34505_c0~~gnl/TRDRNA2_/TRDRNA2_34505_c0_seq1.p1  ORF type:complete len:135 (+),score=20.10 gnl/TRDRNA2_/TRDRNA2_34505_c0_seq1:82-486(+)
MPKAKESRTPAPARPKWGPEGPSEIQQLRYHGAAAAASPAAEHLCAPPGPGAYEVGKRDEALIKESCARTKFAKKPRFKKEPPYLPFVHADTPGPGAYKASEQMSLGVYKVNGTRPPAWKMQRRIPLELAKVSC